MGMTLQLKQISLKELEKIKSDLSYFEKVTTETAPNQTEGLRNLYLSQGITSMSELLEKYPHMKQSGEEVLAQMEKMLFGQSDLTGEEISALSLDKSWHAIHFLLSGEVWSSDSFLGSVLMGGTEIGDESFNTGLGVLRYHQPDKVKRIAENLPSLDELRRSYEPETMAAAGIYAFNADDSEQEWEYLSHFYVQMLEYFQDAARRGNAVLLFVV